MFDFNKIIDRRDTSSLKWDKYKGSDIIPMWVADMDFKSPPEVIEAIQKRAEHGIFGYTLPPESLTESTIRMLKNDFFWDVEPDWLVWLPGLVAGINVSCRAKGKRGGSVLTTIPAYPPFLSAPELSEKKLITVPLTVDDKKYCINFNLLKEACTEDVKQFILCNPHNPTGRVFSRKELQNIADFCLQKNITICSDEIHCGLVLDYDKKHIPIASLSEAIANNTITLMAPSKTYNIPGLGCSFAVISNPSLRKKFQKSMEGIVPHVNLLGFCAAEAAYKNGGKWHRELINYLRKNRDKVESIVSDIPGLSILHIEATYLAWIDARELPVDNPALFFKENGVGLSDGMDFGMAGFVRLNFGTSQTLLLKGLMGMKSAVENIIK